MSLYDLAWFVTCYLKGVIRSGASVISRKMHALAYIKFMMPENHFVAPLIYGAFYYAGIEIFLLLSVPQKEKR